MKGAQTGIQPDEVLGGGSKVAATAGHLQRERGLDDAIGAKVRNGSFEGVGSTFDAAGVANRERYFDLRHGIWIIFEEKLGNFFEKFAITAHAFQGQGEIQ